MYTFVTCKGKCFYIKLVYFFPKGEQGDIGQLGKPGENGVIGSVGRRGREGRPGENGYDVSIFNNSKNMVNCYHITL